MTRNHQAQISKDLDMRADVYQKLHEFNQHIDQGIDTLRSMSQIKNVDRKEIQRYAEYLEELRSSSSGYIASIIFDQEEHVSGKLFRKRRHKKWPTTQCTAAGSKKNAQRSR